MGWGSHPFFFGFWKSLRQSSSIFQNKTRVLLIVMMSNVVSDISQKYYVEAPGRSFCLFPFVSMERGASQRLIDVVFTGMNIPEPSLWLMRISCLF